LTFSCRDAHRIGEFRLPLNTPFALYPSHCNDRAAALLAGLHCNGWERGYCSIHGKGTSPNRNITKEGERKMDQQHNRDSSGRKTTNRITAKAALAPA